MFVSMYLCPIPEIYSYEEQRKIAETSKVADLSSNLLLEWRSYSA